MAAFVVMAVASPHERVGADTPRAYLQKAQMAVRSGTKEPVRSLSLDGATRDLDLVSGGLKAAAPIEMRIMLPDSYSELQHLPMLDLKIGIGAGRPFLHLDPRGRDASSTSSPEGVVDEMRRALAALALGILAEPTFDLRLSADRLRPPDGDCVVLAFQGRTLAGTVHLDKRSHLPVALRYTEEVRFPRKAGVRPGGRPPLPAPPPPAVAAEVDLQFADRRVVDGVSVPFHITKTANGITLRDITIDKVTVNGRLTPGDFQ